MHVKTSGDEIENGKVSAKKSTTGIYHIMLKVWIDVIYLWMMRKDRLFVDEKKWKNWTSVLNR